MKSVDKIRNYINEQKNSGLLKPGDRLPTFSSVMKMFNISYMTASSAINTLAGEGLVEIRQGSGSYLNGAKRLKVLINVQPTTISYKRLEEILKKHLANANLYIDFEFRNPHNLADNAEARKLSHEYKAAISLHEGMVYEQELPTSLLTNFPDYKDVLSGLHKVEGANYEYCLPFAYFSHQMGVNKALLRKAGFSIEDLTMDFRWWSKLVEKCRENGLVPASVDYIEQSPLLFQEFLYLFLSWFPYDENIYENDTVLFNSPQGERLLKLVRDTVLVTPPYEDHCSFFLNGAVFCPAVGSWMTVQNCSQEHPEKAVEELDFIPYRTPDGRKVDIRSMDCLKAYMHHEITPNERERVWKLMKIMVSREFQVDFCGVTGYVSANKNILPTEHFWNRENNCSGFFPDDNSVVIYPKKLLSLSRIAMLSVLLENFRLYNHDMKETLKRMDIKKRCYRGTVSGLDYFPQ